MSVQCLVRLLTFFFFFLSSVFISLGPFNFLFLCPLSYHTTDSEGQFRRSQDPLFQHVSTKPRFVDTSSGSPRSSTAGSTHTGLDGVLTPTLISTNSNSTKKTWPKKQVTFTLLNEIKSQQFMNLSKGHTHCTHTAQVHPHTHSRVSTYHSR